MKKINFLEAITERDIDLLLLEEFHVSARFGSWFINRVLAEEIGPVTFLDAWHSLSSSTLGESDLVLLFKDSAQKKWAILIEDKIDAPPQPNQAARYTERGKAGIEQGDWDLFKTAIVAPGRYLSTSADARNYDAKVSYEALRAWFQHDTVDKERSAYRSRIVQEGIDQNRRGYNPKIDERVTRFWRAYWECASREFPELSMAEPGGKPARSTWISFHPKELGKNRQIWHKMEMGYVDLEIKGAGDAVDAIRSAYNALEAPDTEIVRTGKAASIRVRLTPVDALGDFHEQVDKVRAALRAAYRLLFQVRVVGRADAGR